MKKLAVITMAIFMIFTLMSCGSSADDALDKVISYAKSELDWVELEVSYDDFEYGFDFDGLAMAAYVDSDGYYEGGILEFENTNDAKDAYETIKDDYEEYYDEFLHNGKLVVFGSNEFVNSLN